MHFRLRSLSVLLALAALRPAPAHAQAGGQSVMAVFAHPDDERIVAPMLARYAREGATVHLVIATDGAKGVREHAGVPAGPALAELRANEARCAARRLGIEPPILLGLEDAGLASFASLGRLREELVRLVTTHRPAMLLTIGPEGGTGHPDHRLVGNVITEVVQSLPDPEPPALFYASLPTERMRSAPAYAPQVRTIPGRYLTEQVSFERRDLEAARAAFACHASQYTDAERAAIDAALAHGFDGRVHLRPWNGGRGARSGGR